MRLSRAQVLMAVLPYLLLLLALTRRASSSYCLCKDGVSDALLLNVINWACGNGADCGPVQANGACYSPNTNKDHCNYAANSYYQRKLAEGATCDFNGAATLSASPPANAASGCTYPSSSASATTSTNPSTPSSSTPASPSTTTSTGTTTTGPPPPIYSGLGPSGLGNGNDSPRRSGNLLIVSVAVGCCLGLMALS